MRFISCPITIKSSCTKQSRNCSLWCQSWGSDVPTGCTQSRGGRAGTQSQGWLQISRREQTAAAVPWEPAGHLHRSVCRLRSPSLRCCPASAPAWSRRCTGRCILPEENKQKFQLLHRFLKFPACWWGEAAANSICKHQSHIHTI